MFGLDLFAIAKLAPMVLMLVEVVKRFIPNKHRDIANPVIAVATGLFGAYAVGGQAELLNVLTTGLLAAAGAIGAYKIPKTISEKLNID